MMRRAYISLPEDLLIDISSQLDDQDLCHLELANKGVLNSLSRPHSRLAPREAAQP